MIKSYSSRKSSPNRTPVKKQIKVQSLLDPSRLRPPPPQNVAGNMLSANTRINYGVGVGMQPHQDITLQLDENEILSIPAPPDSSVV